jgi:hypothetical protein
MEVQVDDAAAVAAHRAAAAALLDQQPLEPLVPPGDSLADASLAPPPAKPTARAILLPLGRSVPRAIADLR